MSDDVPNSQLALMERDSVELDELFNYNEALDSHFEESNTSTDLQDVPVTAADGDAAASAILPPVDDALGQQVSGFSGYREVDPDDADQHEDIFESVEHDLHPGTQPVGHADTDPEPEQYAQRTHHESIDCSATIEDAPDDQGSTTRPTTVVDRQPSSFSTVERSAHNDTDMHDSSSLFVPERDLTPHPHVPPTGPSRSVIAPSQQTTVPVLQREAPAKHSMFDKIRTLQKAAQAKRNASNRFTFKPTADDPDPEAYLDAVTSGIRPPAGAYPVEVDEEEMAHRRALAEFQKKKRIYEKIKEEHNGYLPFRQDIEWMKIKGAEDARLKKRRRELVAAQESEEYDLFPQVYSQPEEEDAFDDSDGDLYGASSSRKRRRGDQPGKQSVLTSFQAAERQSMLVALDADDDSPRRKKKKKGAADAEQDNTQQSSAKGKGPKSKAARPSQGKAAGKSSAKGTRKTAKNKRELERAAKQASSLFNANVFEQQAGMGAADQPVLQTRRKAEALKELIASVPLQEKSQAKTDMNILLQASKDFDGHGACKIAPHGNWLVRGMRTSLKGYQVLGSAFMRRRENDAQEPKGGLMADQMGLGKTLMMLGKYVQPLCLCALTLDSQYRQLS